MRIKQKYLISGILAVCLVVAALFGVHVKKSYIDNVDFDTYLDNSDLKVSHCPYPYDEQYEVLTPLEQINNLDTLQEISPVIIQARLDSDTERTCYHECVLSKIKVEKVFCGDLEVGECINIFEPSNCFFSDVMLCTDGYLPMQQKTSYILFLKDYSSRKFNGEKVVYIPTTSVLSKYPVNISNINLFSEEELSDETKFPIYNEIKTYDALIWNQSVFKTYQQIREEILTEYNDIDK